MASDLEQKAALNNKQTRSIMQNGQFADQPKSLKSIQLDFTVSLRIKDVFVLSQDAVQQ